MEWKKTKNVIIFLLAVTNLFLMSFVVSELAEKEQQEEQARSLAVLFLADRGIILAPETLPTEMTLESLELTWDRSTEQKRSDKVLGKTTMESLGGGVVRYYNEEGELRFHSGGEFYGTFHSHTVTGDFADYGRDFLAKLDFEGVLESVEEQGEHTLYHYTQLFNGVPILGAESTLDFEGGQLRSITYGKHLLGEYQVTPNTSITVPTALMKFYEGHTSFGDICREITKIEPMYSTTTLLSGGASLVPIWWIETDTGSYQLDTTTGILLRES
ncbi:MAG: hypothetical protein R3Y07_04050 [Eubacteriales bacterium]